MDATEAQLRFGASLTHSSDLSHPAHPISTSVPSGMYLTCNNEKIFP